MANLKEVSEAAWRQLGGGSDESRLTLEEVIATARVEYAWQMLQWVWREKKDEGFFNMPSHLASESMLRIKNNEADISKLKALNAIPNEMWLLNIGGLTCDCQYIKSTVNQSQLLCDDDSLPEVSRTYIIIGKKIIFPKGTHATELPIIYANDGEDLDESIEVDDAIAGIVRSRLIEIYTGKTTAEDRTNNSNSNN